MTTTSPKGHADKIIAASFAAAGLLCHPASQPKQRVRAKALADGGTIWTARAKDPGTVNVNYGYAGWTDGRTAVSWDPTEFGDIFYRGARVFWWSAGVDSAGLYNEDVQFYVRILSCYVTAKTLFALFHILEDVGAGNVQRVEVVAMPLTRGAEGWTAGAASLLATIAIHSAAEFATGDYDTLIAISQSPKGGAVLVMTLDHIHRVDLAVTDEVPGAAVTTANQVGGSLTLITDISASMFVDPDNNHRHVTSFDYEKGSIGGGSWVVGAIWLSGDEVEIWEAVYQTRTYSRSSAVNCTGGEFTLSWSASSVATEVGALIFPWGSIDLSDASLAWSGAGDTDAVTADGTIMTGYEWDFPWLFPTLEPWIEAFNAGASPDGTIRQTPFLHRDVALIAETGTYQLYDSDGLVQGGLTNQFGSGTLEDYDPPKMIGILVLEPTTGTSQTYPPSTTTTIRARPRSQGYYGDGTKRGQSGAIGNAVFLSLKINTTGPYLNYMTGNPAVTGVFPEGVDLTGRFDPIVPF